MRTIVIFGLCADADLRTRHIRAASVERLFLHMPGVTDRSRISGPVLPVSDATLEALTHATIVVHGANVTRVLDHAFTANRGLRRLDIVRRFATAADASANTHTLVEVEEIGGHVGSCLQALTDLPPAFTQLPRLRRVGVSFFRSSGLVRADLSSVAAVEAIGAGFLADCTALVSVRLPTLARPSGTEEDPDPIGSSFLAGCAALKTVDLSPLAAALGLGASAPASLSDGFLRDCPALAAVDLSPIAGVATIGTGFLANSGVAEVDLSAFHNLDRIRADFLAAASRVRRVVLPPSGIVEGDGEDGTRGVRLIGPRFLSHASALESVDLAGCLTSLERFDSGFCTGCAELRAVVLGSVPAVRAIAGSFLYDCPRLETVTLQDARLIESIGYNFLASARALRQLDISSFDNVESAAPAFLDGATSLEHVAAPPKLRSLVAVARTASRWPRVTEDDEAPYCWQWCDALTGRASAD